MHLCPARALDFIVGFSVSPVLWRRLVRAKSAGRVQSVALRLVVDREAQIETHTATPHWVVNVQLAHADGTVFSAALTALDGTPLTKKNLSEADAQAAAARIRSAALQVLDVGTREGKRSPPAAFSTSTMQQEASRRLGMSPVTTMQIAQSLYEGDVNIGMWGALTALHIVYMSSSCEPMSKNYHLANHVVLLHTL